ncbi:DUF2767 domain-containing protein [Enterobacteriaceae bacterium H11S18]|uniref:DUF2767 domain-containing protein n=1 Tax=Dryocola clanedunensis TaxID=2925396 RepID=UPI0022F0ED20|nr:DUF2767 domain-containing protein [Dryocola clanedunensis]MCT4706229.1 DUF2767 domain-containing protein [Dryocola clanedunensis]MCT4712977.1 DUF2767 domain-containing protein [Dryocola clanedunensis]
MNAEKKNQELFNDVCRVIHSTVIMVRKSGQIINNISVNMMLQARAGESDDENFKRICALAQNMMK